MNNVPKEIQTLMNGETMLDGTLFEKKLMPPPMGQKYKHQTFCVWFIATLGLSQQAAGKTYEIYCMESY